MGDPTPQQAAFCPACERFIGPETACPYCGTDAQRAGTWRALRTAALGLAVVGLACLYLAGNLPERRVTPIGNITPTMNFATVRVTGKLTRNPYVSRKYGRVDYLSFPIEDRTGEIRVAAYRTVARALDSQDRIPAKGTRVSATGSLRVSDKGRIMLYLQAPEQLEETEPTSSGNDS